MGLVARGPFDPRRCRTSHRDVRCSHALPRLRADGVDSLQCRVVRRADAGRRRGAQAWSFLLEEVAAGGPTPPFRFGPARHAFQWQHLDVGKPSFRLAELPPPEEASVPRLKCIEPESLMVLACCAAALSLPLHFGLLEGSG